MPIRRSVFLRSILVFLLILPSFAFAQSSPYRILITNDDGFDAPGILALYDTLRTLPDTEVMIVGPDRNYSGAGHEVMLRDPFSVSGFKRDGRLVGYSVNVPPASCVAIGIRSLMSPGPDLVVSGINPGSNAGLVTFSSGTVAGAREGAMNGIPAVAVSMDRPRRRSRRRSRSLDFTRAAHIARSIVERVRRRPLPSGVFLNVNIPSYDRDIQGVRITRQSTRDLAFAYIKQTSPFGRDFYWQTRKHTLDEAKEGTDEWALIKGYVSITPCTIDQTAAIAIPGLDDALAK